METRDSLGDRDRRLRQDTGGMPFPAYGIGIRRKSSPSSGKGLTEQGLPSGRRPGPSGRRESATQSMGRLRPKTLEYIVNMAIKLVT